MSSENPVVLIDMDGVLADFDGATETFLRANHPNISIHARENFYFREDYPDLAHQDIINQLHASQHFFETLPEIPSAINGWQRIIELGYEPRICSSPLSINQWCETEKLSWIDSHLGSAAVKSAIITKHKEEFDGIALIDDRPDIKNTDQAAWRHIVFGQPYNQHIDTSLRLENWHDDRLPRLLARCAEQCARYAD